MSSVWVAYNRVKAETNDIPAHLLTPYCFTVTDFLHQSKYFCISAYRTITVLLLFPQFGAISSSVCFVKFNLKFNFKLVAPESLCCCNSGKTKCSNQREK